MSDIDSVAREVDNSMEMEGMPLCFEDKDRIHKCLEDLGNLEEIIGSLLERYTIPVRSR